MVVKLIFSHEGKNTPGVCREEDVEDDIYARAVGY